MDRDKLIISATGKRIEGGIADVKISIEGCAADLLYMVNAISSIIALSCGRKPEEAVLFLLTHGHKVISRSCVSADAGTITDAINRMNGGFNQ